MKLSEAVAGRIKQLLKEKNMTLYRLEKISTLSHSTMIDLMKGKYGYPSFKNIMLIIRALDMKTHEFFNDEIFDCEDLEIL